MKITLERKTAPFHYEAKNERQMVINMDSSPKIGGMDKGVSPMEMILMGLGGCASIDLGLILGKQKQVLNDYKLSIVGHRDSTPAKAFETIDMHFSLYGDIDPKKAERALELAITKYCSVAQSLSKHITINTTFDIIND